MSSEFSEDLLDSLLCTPRAAGNGRERTQTTETIKRSQIANSQFFSCVEEVETESRNDAILVALW